MKIKATAPINPNNPAAAKHSIGRLLKDICLFMLPMLKFIEINMGGKLYLPEILLFILFMTMLVTNRIQIKTKLAKTLVILCILWLYGQVLTDIMRESVFIDYSRGWAKIIFTIINFSALYILLTNNKRSIVIFTSGLAVGGVLEYYFNPGVFTAGNPWKFGVGTSLTLFMILSAARIDPNRPFLRIGLLVIVSIINIAMGFRSMGGICFLTAVYVALQYIWGKKFDSRSSLSLKSIALLSTILIAASFLLIQIYGYAARQGILGEQAQQIYEWQAYGDLGIIIGGRSEILASGRAILDSPVIGHGSWAKNEEYIDALFEFKRLIGYYSTPPNDESLIPTHSHIFGAWVEAGILGAVFWGWLLLIPIRCLSTMYHAYDRLTPLYAFICLILIWDIFFSPYAGDRRFITPFYMVVLINIVSGTKSEPDNNPHAISIS